MDFKDKYTTDPKEVDKKLVSNDAMLAAELMDILIAAIRSK